MRKFAWSQFSVKTPWLVFKTKEYLKSRYKSDKRSDHVVYLPVTVDSIYAMSMENNVVSVCIVDAELDCKDVSGHGSNKDKKAKMKKEYYR